MKLEKKLGGGGGLTLGILRREWEWEWEKGVRDAIETQIPCYVFIWDCLGGGGGCCEEEEVKKENQVLNILEGLN